MAGDSPTFRWSPVSWLCGTGVKLCGTGAKALQHRSNLAQPHFGDSTTVDGVYTMLIVIPSTVESSPRPMTPWGRGS